MGDLDFSPKIKSFAYGFRYDGQPVDMLDNEYLTLSLEHEYKIDQSEKEFEEIGLHECSPDTHLNKYYTSKTITNKYGSIYCTLHDQHSDLYGSSQIGYPTKRIKFDIRYCDDQYLQSIKSSKKCKSKEETWEWVNKLDMSAHFEQSFVDLNNIRKLDNVMHT